MTIKELVKKLEKLPVHCTIVSNNTETYEISKVYLVIINDFPVDNIYECLLVDNDFAKDLYIDNLYAQYGKEKIHVEEIQ